jgi:hypothetical protein
VTKSTWISTVSRHRPSALLWQGSGKRLRRPEPRPPLFVIQGHFRRRLELVSARERGKTAQRLLTPHQGEVLYEPQAHARQEAVLHLGRTRAHGAAQAGLAGKKSASRAGLGRQRCWLLLRLGCFFTIANVDGTPELALTDAHGKPVVLPKPSGGRVCSIRFSNRIATWLRARHRRRSDHADVDRPEEPSARKVTEVLPDTLIHRQMVVGGRYASTASTTKWPSCIVRAARAVPGRIDVTAARPANRRGASCDKPVPGVKATWCWCRTCAGRPARKIVRKLDNLDLGDWTR